MASLLNPYLNFNGNARRAMEFYTSVLGGTLNISTFADYGAQGAPDADRVMHAMLETDAGYTIMAADVTSEMEYHGISGCSLSLSGDDGDLLGQHLPAAGLAATGSPWPGRCIRPRCPWTASSPDREVTCPG